MQFEFRILVFALIFASGSAAFAARTGPRLGDAEFFAMLDLSRPDLAQVKKAVDQSDWPAARHALAEHMRTRTTPNWSGEGINGPRRDARGRLADDAIEHRFSSIGIPVRFGDDINWLYNPTTEPGSQYAVNHEWTWQFNRHPFWAALAEAYRRTGDEKYAAEFVAELKSWMHDCPVPLDEPANRPFSPWRTLEAGLRMTNAWPNAFFGVLGSRAFDDDALVLMLKGFADHAQYLEKFQTGGNWLATETNGLYHVGFLFPEFKDAARWRAEALDRFSREIGAQVYPDGVQIELAPGYHGITLDHFLGPVDVAARAGVEPPADYVRRLEPMFDDFEYLMQPTRQTPPLNDSSVRDVRRYMTLGARLYPQRQDFLWLATDGAEGRPPAETSHEFPYGGQMVMRSGWDPGALWALMEVGPFGFMHQHEDKLGVLATAYGTPLLVEGGNYTYDASQWRRYVLTSRAHNVVLVDGMGQNREREPRATFVVKEPLPHVWESTPRFDHAAGYYTEGWGAHADRIVKQTRHLWFFKKEKCFVVADDLEPLDGKPHTYEALFHLNAPGAAAAGLRVDTKNPDGPNLAVYGIGPDAVRIVKGQTKPEVQGWISLGSNYGGLRQVPTAVFSKTAVQGPTSMVYVLYPTPAGRESALKAARLKGDKLTLELADGSEKILDLKR